MHRIPLEILRSSPNTYGSKLRGLNNKCLSDAEIPDKLKLADKIQIFK